MKTFQEKVEYFGNVSSQNGVQNDQDDDDNISGCFVDESIHCSNMVTMGSLTTVLGEDQCFWGETCAQGCPQKHFFWDTLLCTCRGP